MAAKSWSLLTPTVDALKNTIAGLIRDVKKHCFTAAGFYAEAQSTPDRTIAIYAGIVYFGITKVEYDGLAVVDLGTGGAFQTTALTANYYNKVLFTIDYAGTLAMTEGTEHAAAASVVAPAIPESKFPACMVTIQDDGTGTAGTILTIEQSEIQQLQRFASVFKDNDLGTPSAGDLANCTGLPVAGLADFTGKNFIINGGALVRQRTTAFTLVKDTYGIDADRFYGMATGTAVSAGTLTWNQIGGASVGRTGTAFKFSGVTLTGAGEVYLRYRMESKDAAKFVGVNASFSAQVRHDVGSGVDYTIYIRKADAADNFAAVTAISNDTAQSVATGTSTEIKYEAIAMGACFNGIEIEIKVECGAITTKNFYFTELQFEHGDVATAFEHRNIAEEIARCHRYYWKTYSIDVAPGTATPNGAFNRVISAVANADHTEQWSFQYPVRMRAAPTVISYDLAGTAGKASMVAGNGLTATVDQQGDMGSRNRATNGAVATARQLAFHITTESEL